MSFGMAFYDGSGVETLGINSYSLRTVFSREKIGLSQNGEDVALPNFDPLKGVVMVTSAGVTSIPPYSIVGNYPSAVLRFAPAWSASATAAYLILGVHYR